ncbi:MAG: hypothetical protein ACYDCK_08170 [Thermoplasmatota archaeon]
MRHHRRHVDWVKLTPNVIVGRTKLAAVASGLEHVPSLAERWGGEAALLADLPHVDVEFMPDWGYMWVDDEDGCLHVSLPYWKSGPPREIYMDLVHELTHVKQFKEGRGPELFSDKWKYVERPTELEAYRVCVAEGRRIGMTDDDLYEYLFVEWCSHEDHLQLCRAMGVAIPTDGRKPKVNTDWKPRKRK